MNTALDWDEQIGSHQHAVKNHLRLAYESLMVIRRMIAESTNQNLLVTEPEYSAAYYYTGKALEQIIKTL